MRGKGQMLVKRFVPGSNPSTGERQWQAHSHDERGKVRYVPVSHAGVGFPEGASSVLARFRVERLITQTKDHRVRVVGVHIMEILSPRVDTPKFETAHANADGVKYRAS